MRVKSRRLFAVMAVVSAILAPAAVATAGGGGGIDTHECAEDHYDALNPQHFLYGRTQGTPVVDGKMQVDLSGGASGMVAFWDQHFSTDSDGVVLIGTDFADVLCGTTGTDEIWGLMGNDRIFGMGAGDGDLPNFNQAVGSGDRLFGNKGHDFITPGYGTGLGDIDGIHAALTGGGRGNDIIYAGNGGFHTLARGGQGNDEIFGGVGSSSELQVLRGGDGDDTIHANAGDGTMAFGSLGDDTINGGWGDAQDLSGNRGDDTIDGGSGDYQNLYGGGGNDLLGAHSSGDFQALFGGLGNDELHSLGGASGQVADAGPGQDFIAGSTIASNGFYGFGGEGDDIIFGGATDDDLFGDYASGAGEVAGMPAIRGFAPAFFVDPGASGDDAIGGWYGPDTIRGGPGGDQLFGFAPKSGVPNSGLDVADGSSDALFGDDGNDRLFGNGSAAGCPGDSDTADGGSNFAAGDDSWGLGVADTVNVETHNDTSAGCVAP